MKRSSASVGSCPYRLTTRQEKILDSADRGRRHKETAELMGISVNTVKSHIRIILAKTGARSIKEATFKRRHLKPA